MPDLQITLMHGYWYSLCSAGDWLKSAGILYRAGKHAPAMGCAMIGREELGKAELLRKLWLRIDVGDTVTVEEIDAVCGHGGRGAPAVGHLDKHGAVQAGVTFMVMPGTRLAAVLEARYAAFRNIQSLSDKPSNDPTLLAAYKQLAAANAEWDEIVKMKTAKMPELRYNLRNEALYVDLIVEGTRMGWRRPSNIRQDEAFHRIMETMGEYGNITDQVNRAARYPTLWGALEAWIDKPPLPSLDREDFPLL